jgi:hypothetical protein
MWIDMNPTISKQSLGVFEILERECDQPRRLKAMHVTFEVSFFCKALFMGI